MRTTVEIPESLRMRLIEEAARRHERGFSAVVVRALSTYFAMQAADRDPATVVDELYGCEPDAPEPVARDGWRTK